MMKTYSTLNGQAQWAPEQQESSEKSYIPTPMDALPSSETIWRRPPPPHKLPSGNDALIRLSCWKNLSSDPTIEVLSDTDDDFHVVTLVTRRTQAELFIDENSAWKGGMPGQLLVTGPKRGAWRKVIKPPYEHLRVYLPQQLISECFEAVTGHEAPPVISLCNATSLSDHGVSHILAALLHAQNRHGGSNPCLIETLGLALDSRLVACLHNQSRPNDNETKFRSEKLRLQKTLEYINENLNNHITLTQLSSIFGASRCRFTVTFKQHTGYTPHAYVVQQKILRAKEILKNTKRPILEIALDLGFNSQPHFTSSFRKEVGLTPARWRLENL